MKFLTLLMTLIVYLILLLARAQADPSNTLVVDKQGRVYFGDVLHNTVWKIEGGKLTPFLKDKHSHRVALDDAGNLYGEHLEYIPANESWRFHMWKASPAGEVSYVVPPSPGFPWGLLKDKDGNRYEWAGNVNKKDDSRIVRRFPDGRVETLAGNGWGRVDGNGAQAKFTSLGGMAWGPDGALYVTDDVAVRRVTLDGMVTTLLRNDPTMRPDLKTRFFELFPGGSGRLFGLTVDAEGNIYVASMGNGKLLKISPAGKVVAVFPSEKGWTPTGVAVAGTDIYVLEGQSEFFPNDVKGPRVRKIAADGNAVTLGTVGENAAGTPSANNLSNTSTNGWLKWGLTIVILLALAVSAWRVGRLLLATKQSII